MPFDPRDILIPFAMSSFILLISWRPWTRADVHGRWGGPIALMLGFICMYAFITGDRPTLPPNDAIGWLFPIAIGCGILGLLDVLLNPPLRWIGMLLILATSFYLVLRNLSVDLHPYGWIAAMTIVGLIWWLALEQKTIVADRFTAPVAMLLLALFSSALLLMSGSFKYGRLAMPLSGAIAPLIILAAWRSRIDVNKSAVVFVPILMALLIAGHFFSDLTLLNFSLLCIAPLMLFAQQLKLVRRIESRNRVILCIVLLAIPLLLAAALATPEFIRTINENAAQSEQ
jgi:hypothetical protein